jgi:hypothetical protein
VRDVFDKPITQQCQEHRIRNVPDRLPDKLRSLVQRRMREAYHAESALGAEAKLTALAKELEAHPGAAASLREGLQETLTVLRLGVPPTLARTLRSTNPIESMICICRNHCTKRQTPARRPDGPALVRGRHGRSHYTVPPGQRPHAPTEAAHRAGAPDAGNCHPRTHNQTKTAA